jgi:glycolate oxidase
MPKKKPTAEPVVQKSAGEEILTTTELVAIAKQRLPEAAWEFIVGGAETETTAIRNRHALDAIAFRPRVLRNVEHATPATKFFGMKQRIPVILAPIASLTDVDPEGALPVMRGRRVRLRMLVSSVTQRLLRAVAKVAGERWGCSLHGRRREVVVATAKRAVQAGAKTVCVTADVPTFGRRERHIHRRAAMAGRAFGALRTGEVYRARSDWTVIDALKRALDVPLMIKGIQTAEDAELCVKHGVDVIYVSNHGGRQLDHGRGTIELLPEVVSQARGKAQFVIDGGFMRGTDIMKALARGAAMVGIGKLQALALGGAGERGVVRMLEILEAELTVNMKLLGANTCDDLDGTCLQPAIP